MLRIKKPQSKTLHLKRDPVMAQIFHTEGPTSRPQPREVKAVSHSEQSMMTRVTFRINLIQPSNGVERKLQKNTSKKTTSGKKKPGGLRQRTWPLDHEKS